MLAADAELESTVWRPGPARRPARSASPRRAGRASRTGSCPAHRPPGRCGRKPPSASSRENASVICVRSLVPNEQKSASSAISSAVRAARGTSIIVPTRMPRCCPPSSLDHGLGQRRSRAQLLGEADQRAHDLDASSIHRRGPRGRSPAPASRRSRDAGSPAGSRGCPASGWPRAAPRRGRRSALGGDLRLGARRPHRSISSSRSVRSGRNSCSGGSSSRIVTGRPVHRARGCPRSRPAASAAAGRGRPAGVLVRRP